VKLEAGSEMILPFLMFISSNHIKGPFVRSTFDPFRHEKGEDVAVMADCQPAGEAFHSCLVDPDLTVAGDPVYPLAAICFEHLDILERIVCD